MYRIINHLHLHGSGIKRHLSLYDEIRKCSVSSSHGSARLRRSWMLFSTKVADVPEFIVLDMESLAMEKLFWSTVTIKKWCATCHSPWLITLIVGSYCDIFTGRVWTLYYIVIMSLQFLDQKWLDSLEEWNKQSFNLYPFRKWSPWKIQLIIPGCFMQATSEVMQNKLCGKKGWLHFRAQTLS